ncbi:MAG: hypothetical protein IH598_01560 [Bacteroidales bacterium]|nr:hypothetical protein [Bacteroidales bacterium]
MKKLLLLFFIVVFSSAVHSQEMTDDGRCAPHHPITANMVKGSNQMGDFTITDSDGVTRNLYETLDQGMTIMLDLFFTT